MNNVLQIQTSVNTDPLDQLARATLVVRDTQEQLRGTMNALASSALAGSAQSMRIVTDAYKENYVATQALKQAQLELKNSMTTTNRSMLELRQGAMLAGQEIGVRIPRALTSVAIRMPAIAGAINAAFSAIIVIAFIQILSQVVQKVLEVSAAFGGLTAKTKEFYQELLEGNRQAFIDFTNSAQGYQRIAELNQRIADTTQQIAVAEEMVKVQGNQGWLQGLVGAGLELKNLHDLRDQLTSMEQERLEMLTRMKTVLDQEHNDKTKQLEQEQRDQERVARQHELQLKKGEEVAKKIDQEIMRSHQELNKELERGDAERNRQITLDLEQQLKAEKQNSDAQLKASKEELRAFSEQDRAQQQAIAEDVKASVVSINAAEQVAQHRVKTFTLSNADYIKQMLAFEQQKYEVQRNGLQQRLALAQLDPNLNPQTLARLQGQLEVLEQQHQSNINKIQQQAIDYRAKLNQDFNRNIQSGFQSTLKDMASGNANFGKDVMNIFSGVESAVFNVLSQMLTNWIETHLLMKLIGGTTNSGQIASNAGVAASGAYASTAMIPIVGPELAPAAAATALAGAMGFESLAFFERGGNVAENQLAYLHRNEMVLPAPLADNVRQGASGSLQVSYNPTVQAMDANGVDQVLTNHRQVLVKHIKTIMRQGHV